MKILITVYVILFRHEDAAKAYESSQDKLFFGTRIEVSKHPGFGEFY